jgi:tetratricopeptide (TPR) repeat protein
LLLPQALWEGLTEQQRGTLLAHELAHLRRGDHWVRWLELLVLGLYWWHPAVWWARRELREAEEQCCDAWVLWALPDAAEAYARALLATLAFLSGSRPPLPVGASGAGRVYLLKRRLTMILRGTTSQALGWPGFLALVLLGAVLLPLLPTWAQRPREEPTQPQAADEPTDPTKKDADEVLERARKLRERGREISPPADPNSDQAKRKALLADLLATFTSLFKEGKYEEAEHYARKALKIDPQNPAAVAAVEVAQVYRGQAKDPSGREVPSRTRTEEAGQPNLAEQIERARDEVELLEAQLQVKKIQVKAAQDAVNRARQHFERIKQMLGRGSITESDYMKAAETVASLETDALLKEAELKEPQVRLNQAKRRLDALLRQAPSSDSERKASWADAVFQEIYKDFGPVRNHRPVMHKFRLLNRSQAELHIAAVRSSCACLAARATETTIGPGQEAFIETTLDPGRFNGPKVVRIFVQFDKPIADEAILLVRADSRSELPTQPEVNPKEEEKQRLLELEKKIDTLLKELEQLRKDLPRRPGPGKEEESHDNRLDLNVLAINRRSFRIPINVEESQKQRIRSLLLFYSLNEGHGWVQIGNISPEKKDFDFAAPKDGLYWIGVMPLDEKGYPSQPEPRVTQKILIDTKKPEVRAKATREGDELVVAWEAQDENLDPSTAVVEYRQGNYSPWTPLPVSGPGQVKFKPAGPGPVAVRIRVRDTAGNEGVAVMEAPGEVK